MKIVSLDWKRGIRIDLGKKYIFAAEGGILHR